MEWEEILTTAVNAGALLVRKSKECWTFDVGQARLERISGLVYLITKNSQTRVRDLSHLEALIQEYDLGR